MTGQISGDEAVKADEDIEYHGTLTFDVDLDLCEADRKPDGESQLCALSVKGIGPLDVEVDVYADNRGGYVKARKSSRGWVPSMGGSCRPEVIASERAAFPNNSMSNVFNGVEFTIPSGPLKEDATYPAGTTMKLQVVKKVR